MDGYSGYNRLTKDTRADGPLKLAFCWAHAPSRRCKHRLPGSGRKLKEVYDRDGSEIAAESLRRIAEFYKIEAEIRGTSADQRLAARKARTKPLMDDFGLWLRDQRSRISAKSRLGEKLAYISRHWDGLQIFLTDGRVEIDSNPVERTIRPITLNRKNALFAGHDEGGKNWGRIASLIETCKLNGVEPFAYLKATLQAIASGTQRIRSTT
jgi:transposase